MLVQLIILGEKMHISLWHFFVSLSMLAELAMPRFVRKVELQAQVQINLRQVQNELQNNYKSFVMNPKRTSVVKNTKMLET